MLRLKWNCYYKCKYVFNRIQGSYLRVMARPKGFCLGTAVPIASLRSLPRLKNSPPDCFFTPCSNPFGLVEQKNKVAFYDATLSLCEDRTIEMFLHFHCLDLNTRHNHSTSLRFCFQGCLQRHLDFGAADKDHLDFLF